MPTSLEFEFELVDAVIVAELVDEEPEVERDAVLEALVEALDMPDALIDEERDEAPEALMPVDDWADTPTMAGAA